MSNKYRGGFEDRQEVKTRPISPIDFSISWATRDSNWRLRVMPGSPFKDKLKATSGTATELQGVILESALYQAGGKNYPTTAYISSNLCREGMMDVLIVRQRPIRGDSKVIAVGPWGDIKDDITEPRRYGARWEHVIIALVTSVKVAPWDKETERNLKAKTIKGRFIVKIELPGFSFRDGYQQSAKDDEVANDGRKIYNQPFKYDGGKNYLNPQPKNNPDHYYPRFHFLRYEDMKEEIADPLFEAAKDGFQQFWNGYFIPHIEYTKKQLEGGEYEDPDEDTDNEETPDDIPEAFQTKAERKKTKTEKKVEEKRRRAAGKKNFEKVETEKDPEAALQAALESAGIKTDDLDPELIATLKARASKNKQVDDDLKDSTDDDLEESDDALGDEEFDDLEF